MVTFAVPGFSIMRRFDLRHALGADPVGHCRLQFRSGRLPFVMMILCAAFGGQTVRAEPGDGRHGPAADAPPAQWQILRERHEIRRDIREDGMIVERRHVMRERWQQISPEDRQKWLDQRRQMRQLTPEERQQLRRDILEANRPPREEH